MEWLIGIGILLIFIVLGVFLGTRANKQMESQTHATLSVDKIDFKNQFIKKVPYISQKEMRVYEIFEEILPVQYVIFPRVGVRKIVKQKGSIMVYNQIRDMYLDMVIFKRSNMEPVMILDIYDTSIAEMTLQEYSKVLAKTVASVNIPVMKVEISESYNKNELLSKFLDNLNPVALAELRQVLQKQKKPQ